MATKLNKCGRMMKTAVDNLSDKQKRDRNAVYNAMGGAIEQYIADLLAQLQVTIPPTAALGTSTTPGNPTAPGPALVTLPPGRFK